MSSTAERLITIEEFSRLPGNKHLELVRGRIVQTMPPGGRHGEIAAALVTLLRIWAKQGVGGYTAVESGYILGHDPDTLRAPDVSYVRADRIPSGVIPDAYWTIAPDLAVEVVSPSETAEEIREKVRDYLAAGTPLVWLVYVRTGEVIVHTADGMAKAHKGDDVIEYPDVLPGFSCRVSELFA